MAPDSDWEHFAGYPGLSSRDHSFVKKSVLMVNFAGTKSPAERCDCNAKWATAHFHESHIGTVSRIGVRAANRGIGAARISHL